MFILCVIHIPPFAQISETANVYDAKELGMRVLMQMNDVNIFSYTYSRKDKATIMEGGRTMVTEDNEVVPVDSDLLFQRLIATLDRKIQVNASQSKLSEALCHEMSTVPASLFNSTTHLMLEAKKSDLVEKIRAKTDNGE